MSVRRVFCDDRDTSRGALLPPRDHARLRGKAMRIIARSTLRQFWEIYPDAE